MGHSNRRKPGKVTKAAAIVTCQDVPLHKARATRAIAMMKPSRLVAIVPTLELLAKADKLEVGAVGFGMGRATGLLLREDRPAAGGFDDRPSVYTPRFDNSGSNGSAWDLEYEDRYDNVLLATADTITDRAQQIEERARAAAAWVVRWMNRYKPTGAPDLFGDPIEVHNRPNTWLWIVNGWTIAYDYDARRGEWDSPEGDMSFAEPDGTITSDKGKSGGAPETAGAR